jgi:hypothetical protein
MDVLTLLQAGSVQFIQSLGPGLYDTPPDTVIGYVRQKGVVLEAGTTLKATYETSDDSVHVSQGLVETMGASDAALAFVIAHMMARGVLLRTGLPSTGLFSGLNMQVASDLSALGMMVATGYDPGGIADFYSRLFTASGEGLSLDPFLLSEFGPLSQIATRQAQIWTNVIQGCAATPGLIQLCQKAHDYWHQSYPSNIP